MTVEQLNELLGDLDEILEERALPELAAAYEELFHDLGAATVRRFRERAQSLTAAAVFVAPDADEVLDPEVLTKGIEGLTLTQQEVVKQTISYASENHGIIWDIHGEITPDMSRMLGQRLDAASRSLVGGVYRPIIEEGFNEGWSIDRTADELQAAFVAKTSYQAEALARTDLIGLANGASHNAATRAFKEREDVFKQWLSTDDDRTRETHVDADGQTKPMKEWFTVGGAALRFPGDPFGPDDEVINCRCTILYTTEVADKDPLETVRPTEDYLHSVKRDLWTDSEVWRYHSADLEALGYPLDPETGEAYTFYDPTNYEGNQVIAKWRQQMEEMLTADLARPEIEVKVRAEYETVEEIVKDGRFQSQYESGSSRGLFDPEVRRNVEHAMFSYNRSVTPDEKRPIYGYLGGPKYTDEVGSVAQYGDVSFVLKPEIKARTTFTSYDSLNSGLVPSPVLRPSLYSIRPKGFTAGEKAEIGLDWQPGTWGNVYWEAQIHGGVSMDDVARIEIYSYGGTNAADNAMAASLRERLGVPVDVFYYSELTASGADAGGLASFADDLVLVDGIALQDVPPVPTSEDRLDWQLGVDPTGATIEHPADAVALASLSEHEERVLTPDPDGLHIPDYTSSIATSVLRRAYSAETMPWRVQEKHSDCPADRPFAVVKNGDDSVAGCHSTRAAATRQLRALYAKEGKMSTTVPIWSDNTTMTTAPSVTVTVNGDEVEGKPEYRRVPWEGILAVEGHPSSDRRYLIPGEIDYRDLPLPIAPSHDKQYATETVGRIEVIEHIPVAEFERENWELPDMAPHAIVIWGEGTFDGSPAAEDALRQLENGVGISLDLPTERQALIDAASFEEVDPSEISEEDMLALALGMVPEGYLRGFAGKIGGASLASIAAFEETRIRLVDGHALVASGFAIREVDLGEPIANPLWEWVAEDALAASAAPIAPPRDWFFVEEPDEPTPLAILPNGQFYFHLALWNTCHAGRANGAYAACMYAPHSRSHYSQFHLGAILCDDGSEVPIGRLTIGTGHAPLHMNAARARAHYDNTGTCVAFGRAYDGVFGIWVCGVIKSDATAEQVRDFRACPASGDWRNHDGALELQAALAVNTPAFPVVRSQLALSAAADSLEIAALILGPPAEEDFAEALRIEHGIQESLDTDMLVELVFYDE